MFAGIQDLFGVSLTRCRKLLFNTVSAIHHFSEVHVLKLCSAINTKGRLYFEDVSLDPRFLNEAEHSAHSSIICIPILSNRGQTFGAVYLAAKYAFPRTVFTILSMLFEQASISISNALLFRSVQGGTRENLKMIASQRAALETARKSREDALKATKVRSIDFLRHPWYVVLYMLTPSSDQEQFSRLHES